MPPEDFEVIEPGDYTPKKDQVYSHSMLLMNALKECSKARSEEMRDGYYNMKFDRLGNAHRVWIPDARDKFIQTVEALMMIQERDYDPETTYNLFRIEEWLDKKYKEYVELEKKEWDELDFRLKTQWNSEGVFFRDGMLSEKHLPYYRFYIRDKLDAYTRIVSVIQKLIGRLGDYGEAEMEA